MASIRLADAAKFFKGEPHQLAGWNWLQEHLTAEVLAEFGELYRAAPAEKEALPAAWLAPSLAIIKEFEGCKLKAYQDVAKVWTVGWGTTIIDGQPVGASTAITQAKADDLLGKDLGGRVDRLFKLLPMASKWGAKQQAAVISWAYNVGLGAVEDSTLRKRLLAGEAPIVVIPQELPKWSKAGGQELPGLLRRRNAEVALFLGSNPVKPAPAAKSSRPLKAPYFSQRDSQVAGQAMRMCFSSSCAMLAAFLRPGCITGANADDQYLKRVQQFGDSTDAGAQLKALESFGIKARFVQNADWADLERQISRSVPVPVGFLHHGPVHQASGGGHWLLVTDVTNSYAVVNDPFGEIDLIGGTYLNSNGSGLKYSKANFWPRWCVEGQRSGWAIIAEP